MQPSVSWKTVLHRCDPGLVGKNETNLGKDTSHLLFQWDPGVEVKGYECWARILGKEETMSEVGLWGQEYVKI